MHLPTHELMKLLLAKPMMIALHLCLSIFAIRLPCSPQLMQLRQAEIFGALNN